MTSTIPRPITRPNPAMIRSITWALKYSNRSEIAAKKRTAAKSSVVSV